jgi:serine/threonine protein kinase
MALDAGTHLGPYRITSLMGAGGMGEVYRALDPRLAREVAIKVIREGSASADGLARVEKEARLLASLNHPGIALLYGMEEWNGSQFLVMELVEGETLAERIRRGPISVAESLSLFWQIAQALEAAHHKRIIHRDLKPANIKITPDGKTKVLDFGLAKAFVSDLGSTVPAESPTITRESRVGGIGGTIAYMSPEQARGQSLDQRTDIWSYGCCWYETISGSRAFHGKTAADTIAAVLRSEPDWDKLPRETPAEIRSLLRRCLERKLSRRAHDMIDVRLAIERVFHPSPALASPFATTRERLSPVTLQPHDEKTPTERAAWNWKADLRVDRQGFSDAPPVHGTDSSSGEKARQPRSCTLTLGIAFTMLAALGTGIYLFRSARTLAPVENQPTVAWTPELEERRLQEQSARLKLDADEVLDEIDELKNDDAAADETVWKRAESLEAMGRQAYDAQDYETASRRFQTALDVYQSARSAASTAGREVSVGTVQTAPDPDRRAIQAALADYEKALETKDLALFRTVKPNLSSDEERVLEERSRTAGPHDIELRTDNIVIQGEEATAQVTQVMQGDTRKLTFGLQKQGSRWVIVLIEMHQ